MLKPTQWLRPSGLKSLAVLGVVAVVAIGGGVSMSTAPVAAQGAAQSAAPRPGSLTLDEQLLEVAKGDPAFGGMFFDNQGRLSMYVMESALAAQDGFSRLAGMSLSVESAFRGNPMMAAAATQRVQILPAQYSFMDLYSWNEMAKTDVLTIPGVVLTDIAEDKNRLRIGIERAGVANAVRQRLASRGIPADAVSLEVTGPFRFMSHTLRSKVRPLTGGLQINFGGYVCTLGFLAVRAGVPGFVTNSHCTTIQGGNNNTIFHQPLASGTTNRIGVETVDPAYFTGGVCPATRRCRYSDSAFARVPHPSGPAVTTARGFIARPVSTSGTLTINHVTPTFRITSENSTPVLNETLNKVGRTTGWSQGRVVLTCATVGVSGTNITQICQDVVRARVAGGDSGSPVFRITSGSNVRLYGILWGGGTISGNTVFVFSALGTRNVQKASEMGTLTTCAVGYGC